jgi:hypothetical protein
MLKKPLVIDGFYLDSETGGIEQTGLAYYKKGGFGVTYSYEQAEGIVKNNSAFSLVLKANRCLS